MIGLSANGSAREKLTALLFLAVASILLFKLASLIATGDFYSVFFAAAGLVGLGVCGAILTNWRNGLYLFLVWLLFEDLLRKYMGNNMAIYFGKDVLVAIIYLSFLLSRTREVHDPFRPPFKNALALFVLLGVAQAFNPFSPSMFYGILGLKLYFYYIPLMFVGYALIRVERDLHRFLIINMGLAAVIALVGLVQAMFGLDILNPHGGADLEMLGHLVRRTQEGIAVPRPPSVFVSDGRFGAYLLLAFVLAIGTAGYLFLRTKNGRALTFPTLALVGVAAVMTGSRGAFLTTSCSLLVLSLGLLWGAPEGNGDRYRIFKAIRRSFVFTAIVVALSVTIFPTQIGARLAFYKETLSPWSPYFEVSHRLGVYSVQNFTSTLSDPLVLIGHGTGTASLGAQYVTRIMGAPATGVATESGPGTLILEFGIIGLVLWLCWTVILSIEAAKVTIRLKGTWAFPVAISITWFSFLLLFLCTYGGMQQYQNFVLNAYFWLLVGILFRLPSLVDQDSLLPVPLRAS